MTDYLTEDNSFLVETDRFVTASKDISCISPYYVGQLFPELGKPVVKKFGERMREVYENYSLAQKKAKIFSAQIKSEYNWDVCTEKLIDVISKLKN